jgi:hypothetical protein
VVLRSDLNHPRLKIGSMRAMFIGWRMIPLNAPLPPFHTLLLVLPRLFNENHGRWAGSPSINSPCHLKSFGNTLGSPFVYLSCGIKGVQVSSRASRLRHCSQMGPFLGVARVLLSCLLVSAVAANNACKNPRVRREWRKLTTREQAEWISAVDVLVSWFSHYSRH